MRQRNLKIAKDAKQPGIVDWGMFVTISHVPSSRNNHLWVREVHAYRNTDELYTWRWNTLHTPREIYDEVGACIDATLDGYLARRFGIGDKLFE